MNINLKAVYSTSEHRVLCFKCAVMEAIKDKDVTVEVDDYSSDYDMRSTQCIVCGRCI